MWLNCSCCPLSLIVRSEVMSVTFPFGFQSCPHGYTEGDIDKLFGQYKYVFYAWMCGQTVGYCDGRMWDHEMQEHVPSQCSAECHGAVVYPVDVKSFWTQGCDAGIFD